VRFSVVRFRGRCEPLNIRLGRKGLPALGRFLEARIVRKRSCDFIHFCHCVDVGTQTTLAGIEDPIAQEEARRNTSEPRASRRNATG
jgi:hypothetical protein